MRIQLGLQHFEFRFLLYNLTAVNLVYQYIQFSCHGSERVGQLSDFILRFCAHLHGKIPFFHAMDALLQILQRPQQPPAQNSAHHQTQDGCQNQMQEGRPQDAGIMYLQIFTGTKQKDFHLVSGISFTNR